MPGSACSPAPCFPKPLPSPPHAGADPQTDGRTDGQACATSPPCSRGRPQARHLAERFPRMQRGLGAEQRCREVPSPPGRLRGAAGLPADAEGSGPAASEAAQAQLPWQGAMYLGAALPAAVAGVGCEYLAGFMCKQRLSGASALPSKAPSEGSASTRGAPQPLSESSSSPLLQSGSPGVPRGAPIHPLAPAPRKGSYGI